MSETIDRRELERRVLDRVRRDEAFRALLVRDPREAIADELGAALPDDLNVEVREVQPNTLHLVVPAMAELDDADLDGVTGGWWGGAHFTYDDDGGLAVVWPT